MAFPLDPGRQQVPLGAAAADAVAPGARAPLRPHQPPVRAVESTEAELIRHLFNCFGIRAPLATSRLAVGHTYCNFLVDMLGARFVARSVPSRRSARLHREALLLRALAGTPLARRIPQLVPPIDHATPWVSFGERDWLISRFSHGFNAKPPRGERPHNAVLFEIGAFVGDLSQSMACVAVNLDPPFDHKGHLTKVLDHFEAMCRGSTFSPPTEHAVDWRATLEPRIGPLKDLLTRASFDAAIHGDIRFANLIFDGRGAVRTILDFDRAGLAPPLLEHALAMRNLLVCESADPRQAGRVPFDAVAAYMRGYQSSAGQAPFAPRSPVFLSFMEMVALDELYFAATEGDRLASKRRTELATTAWGLFCRAGSATPWSL